MCPRCRTNFYSNYGDSRAAELARIGIFPPALSRTDNATDICSDCGTDEALDDLQRRPLTPPDDWPIA